LATEDFRFRILGEAALRPLLQDCRNVDFLSTGTVEAVEFYRSLGCFFRTGTFFDTFSHVVFEAMACGLPVVCDRFGGHAEYITHGHDGLLFEGQQQVMELLRELPRHADLRRRIGTEARRTVERMYSHEASRRRVEELLN
jgi:glycosyltransferase involved in cell wall biosynthesis